MAGDPPESTSPKHTYPGHDRCLHTSTLANMNIAQNAFWSKLCDGALNGRMHRAVRTNRRPAIYQTEIQLVDSDAEWVTIS